MDFGYDKKCLYIVFSVDEALSFISPSKVLEKHFFFEADTLNTVRPVISLCLQNNPARIHETVYLYRNSIHLGRNTVIINVGIQIKTE